MERGKNPVVDDPKPEFEEGCFVQLTKEGLKVKSTPAQLHKVGWPNKFLVSAIHSTGDDVFLELDPCCAWMEEPSDRTKVACKAHPSKYFELLPGHMRDEIEAEENSEEKSEESSESTSSDESEESTPETEPETVKIPKVLAADNPDVQAFEFQGIQIRINKSARAIMFQKEGGMPVIARGAFANKMMGWADQMGML